LGSEGFERRSAAARVGVAGFASKQKPVTKSIHKKIPLGIFSLGGEEVLGALL